MNGKQVSALANGAMHGFGLGLMLAVLVTLATTAPPITVLILLQNPLVLIFTFLGLAQGFEEWDSSLPVQTTPPVKL